MDTDNQGLQFTRYIYDSGYHSHNVDSNSNTGFSSLRETGGDAEHENRPPYYVVQYIIYIP